MNHLLLFGQEITPIRKLLLMHMVAGGGLNEYEATGNPAVFNTNVEKPLTQLLVPFTPVQEGTGNPSPSNVRPITGWTGVTINRTGKNLLNPIWWNDVSNISYVNYTDGTIQQQSNAYKASDYVNVVGNVEYTLHAGLNAQARGGMAFYDADKQYISGIQMKSATKTDYTFTTPINAVYMRFSCLNTIVPFDEVMLVYGSTAPTSYAPYSGNSYPVTFPAMGKNLLPFSTGTGLRTASGSASGGNYRYIIDGLKPNTDYTLQVTITESWTTTTGRRLYVYPFGGSSSGSYIDTAVANVPVTKSKTAQSNEYGQLVIQHNSSALNDDSYAASLTNLQLEEGSTATTYEPYTNTVYGGSLDVVTGELTVTLKKLHLLPADWSFQSTAHSWYINLSNYPDIKQNPSASSSFIGYCDTYTIKGYTTLTSTNNSVAVMADSNAKRIYCRTDGTDETVPEELDFVLELATPITYQLTPQQINTLIGDNTIWSDTNGENTIKYLKKG